MPIVKSTDSRCSPGWRLSALHAEFNITLDPCPFNPDYVDGHDIDGLQLDWSGHVVFCNPPWSDIKPWVHKAVSEQALTIMVLPVRTDTAWFQLLRRHGAELRFFARRVYFTQRPGMQVDKSSAHANGGTVVAILNKLSPKKSCRR